MLEEHTPNKVGTAAADEQASGPGIYRELGQLPPATVVTADGLAALLGKACRESIKRAVDRGELPPPVKIMGKNSWTVGCIVRFIDARLETEARKCAQLPVEQPASNV